MYWRGAAVSETLRPMPAPAPLRALLLAAACAFVPVPLDAQDAAPAPESPPAAAAAAEPPAGSTLVQRFRQGGFAMWPILGLSMLALTYSLERAVNLRRARFIPQGFADEARRLWQAGDHAALARLCAERPSTLARIVALFSRHRTAPVTEVSMLAGDIAAREVRQHLQKTYPLTVAATLSPLLGLFGTVSGMIDSFEVVAIAGSLGDASLLADGIAKALITTAFGLIIAVPALGAYHYFRSRTQALGTDLEGEVNELLTEWFFERTQEPRD